MLLARGQCSWWGGGEIGVDDGLSFYKKQCTVFVVPQPENLEDYNGFAHATSDPDRKKSMKTIGIEDEMTILWHPHEHGEYFSTVSRNSRTSLL